ncbi:MAG: hypothetical protein N2C14_12470 [Planctomycetales bacterium]
MNKLALFCEGQTECIFAERLIRHVAGEQQVTIQVQRMSGPRHLRRIVIEGESDAGDNYFVLLVNCGQDESVKSDIRDQYDGLISLGYQTILGFRDVHPLSRDDLALLREGLEYQMPTAPILPCMILAIMEVEAWFLAEHTHFPRIHKDLNVDRIKTNS